MIVVHHLEQSRSTRIMWLLEEIGAPYEVKRYKRDPQTRMAEPAFKKLHALGRSPTVEIDGVMMAESGAIIEFLAETQGGGKLSVAPGAAGRADYLFWLHYAEGSAMAPISLSYVLGAIGEAAAPMRARVEQNHATLANFLEDAYRGKDFLVDGRFTAADLIMDYVLDLQARLGGYEAYPNMKRVRDAFHARPAHQRAEKRDKD